MVSESLFGAFEGEVILEFSNSKDEGLVTPDPLTEREKKVF